MGMEKEKTVAIHVAVEATVFGKETVCYADYRRECLTADDTDYGDMPIEWIEANCDMLQIHWDDDPEDDGMVLNEISLVEAKALCTFFHFDVDWSEE